MAHVGPDKKAKIAAALKACMPKGWKYSLAVRRHSTIALTIYASPIDLDKHFEWGERRDERDTPRYLNLNPYHWRRHMTLAPPELIETLGRIFEALNIENFDHSDPQSDYFHVGHYVDVNIGRWDRPHQLVDAPLQQEPKA